MTRRCRSLLLSLSHRGKFMECREDCLKRVSRDFLSVFQRRFHPVLPGDVLLQVVWRQADGGLFKERVSRDFFLFFSGDVIQSCPAMCSCKWSGGKQTVDCLKRESHEIFFCFSAGISYSPARRCAPASGLAASRRWTV
jgi:hypothetical protein